MPNPDADVAADRGKLDGAAIHLLHHTGVYDAPFALGMLRGLERHLIHLWRREQGLIGCRATPTASPASPSSPAARPHLTAFAWG